VGDHLVAADAQPECATWGSRNDPIKPSAVGHIEKIIELCDRAVLPGIKPGENGEAYADVILGKQAAVLFSARVSST
jgi:hypothetical protein